MTSPCGKTQQHHGCPFRKDTAPGEFCQSKYDELRNTIGSDENMVAFGQPMFACHKSAEGREVACAGWLATHGQYHLTVRLALAMHHISPEDLRPKEGWPELYTDYDELVREQARED